MCVGEGGVGCYPTLLVVVAGGRLLGRVERSGSAGLARALLAARLELVAAVLVWDAGCWRFSGLSLLVKK